MKQVNGRVLWLQESLVQAASFASTFEMVAQKRDLTRKEEDMVNAVSYTHLTLPTICSV